MKSADRDQAIARVVVSFAARAPGTTPEPRTQPMASAGTTFHWRHDNQYSFTLCQRAAALGRLSLRTGHVGLCL